MKCVLDLLRAQAHFCQVAAAALRTATRGRRIGLHAPGRSAGVALKRVRALVVRERCGAVVAGGHAAAFTAHQKRRKAATVVQQHGLLAALDHTLEAFHQRFREHGAAAVCELAAQVGDPNRGQHGVSRALGHLDARPSGPAVRAAAAAVEGLGRGRGGAQHERTAIATRHLGRYLARVVARAGALLVTGLVLLVDDDEAQITERAKERRAGAHDHARGTAGDHVPLVQTLAGRKTRMEHSDRLAKARAEAADGLSRQRDLGHKHASRAAGRQHALNRRKVDLGFAGTGDAVDKDHITVSVQACALNLRECLPLAVGESHRGLAARRGQRGLLAAATPGAALLHHHDAAFFERLNGRRHTVVEQVEVARRDRATLECLDELTLTDRGLGRRVVKTLGSEHDPAVLDGFNGGALNGPHAVLALDHARASTRGQEKAQALGKRCDVLAAHPARNACGLGGKERLAEDSLDRLDAHGVEGVVALQVAQLGRDVDDVARGRTVAKMNEDGGADLGIVGERPRNAVGKRLGKRTSGNVEDNARIGGGVLGCGLGLRRGGGRGRGLRSFLRFRRTKQRKLLGHGPSTSYPIRLQKQEPRSGERGSDTSVYAAATAPSCGRGRCAPGSRRGRRAPWSRPAGGSPCCRRRRRARPGTPCAS